MTGMTMNGSKLREALAELQAQRNILDAAISQIQKVLALLDGTNAEDRAHESFTTSGRASYVDDAVKVFEAVGHPLHINDLIVKIGELRNKKIARPSLESSLIRHITKVDKPRIAKLNPSTYGLPAWKNQATASSLLITPMAS
jgi:hypothetical protein